MTEKKVPEIALYETDVQKDFSFRHGALFVNGQKDEGIAPYGAEAVVPTIVDLHRHANEKNWQILGSVDRHFFEDAELIRNEGGVFEDHCMNGTEGQVRIFNLEPQKDIYIQAKEGPLLGQRKYSESEIQKFIDAGMQLIFEKQSYDVLTNPNFEMTLKMLARQGLKKIVVVGFATDYCVAAVVYGMTLLKSLNDLDVSIYVVEDGIEAVNINFDGEIDMRFGEKALEKMLKAGAEIISKNDILNGVL